MTHADMSAAVRPDVQAAPMDLLSELSRDVAAFVTDVIPQSVRSPALKCAKEAREFADEPSLEEAADVLTCLLGWLHLAGHEVIDLLAASHSKMAVNLARTWEKQSDGTWQHIEPSTR